MIISFPNQQEQMRYHYNPATGRFTQTTSDNAAFDLLTEPYIIKNKGWIKSDYRMQDGECVYDPLPQREITQRG
jgi:hypothetical protein